MANELYQSDFISHLKREVIGLRADDEHTKAYNLEREIAVWEAAVAQRVPEEWHKYHQRWKTEDGRRDSLLEYAELLDRL